MADLENDCQRHGTTRLLQSRPLRVIAKRHIIEQTAVPANWENRCAVWQIAAANTFEQAEQHFYEGRRGFEMAEKAIHEAKQMRQSLNPLLEQLTNRTNGHTPSRPRRIDDALRLTDACRDQLSEILGTAILTTRADMGNIQLFDPSAGGLQIAVQQGFERPFLEFFNLVHDGEAACGTALQTGQRIVVEDVTESPIFYRTPALEVLLDARVRSVQSTLIVGDAGQVFGVLSTHYRKPHRPTRRDVCLLDLLSRQIARRVSEQ